MQIMTTVVIEGRVIPSKVDKSVFAIIIKRRLFTPIDRHLL